MQNIPLFLLIFM